MIYLFVWVFLWAAFSTQLDVGKLYPKKTGMGEGQIHFVPKCKWLAQNILGSWHSKLPTAREMQEVVDEFNRCNAQNGDQK